MLHIVSFLGKYLPSRRKFLITLGFAIAFVLGLYVFLFVYASNLQMLMTFPGKDVNLKELTNHPAGLIYGEEIDVVSTTGNNIHGIFIDTNAEKTVYYFHGNGAPMEYFYTEMRYIADLGYNLISYDFPGYGKSEGEPTTEEVFRFSNEFYEHIKKEKGIQDEDVIIWGYSVGSAVAVDFIGKRHFDSLILFSPFASRYDMSAKVFGFPIQKLFFLKNSLITSETIKHITVPTFIIHGNKDIVVPFQQGKSVFDNSGASLKYFLEIDDFGHSLITERYGDVLRSYIEEFLGDKQFEDPYIFLSRDVATSILEEQNYLANLDMKSDTSFQKFVNPDVSFTDVAYVPEDLETIEREFVIDTKGNAQLRPEARKNFEAMAEAFYERFGEKMVVVSSYRSYAYQAGIKARGCPDNLCAKAGHSEHQGGLTIDLWSASTQAYWENNLQLSQRYAWLLENAHTYGFHNTYQKGRDIDGYEIEPWHWRYVGETFARHLQENNMTIAEFYKKRED